MTHTALPSVKGQITIPADIREKYHINKETPLVIEDKGNGTIVMKVMQLVPQDAIHLYENKGEYGISFKNGIDPQILIDAIKKIDG